MELWGKEGAFRGAVYPAFFSRSGEPLPVPEEFQDAVARISAAVCCIGCCHCHLLQPETTSFLSDAGSTAIGPVASEAHSQHDDAKDGDLATIEAILRDPAASFWLKAALLWPYPEI
jgi:hypothetical protein